MSGLLDGRVAAITGGANGLGASIAETFVDEGARVAILDLNEAAAIERAAALGERALGIRCDVTDPESVDAAMAAVVGHFGRIDTLVNNAGITRDGVLRKMTPEDFKMVLDVHVFGGWLCTRAAVAAIRETSPEGGAIINMSSISGKVGNPGQTNYSTAKAGLIGLTKATAKEVARYNIRVNAVQPGLIRTAMTDAMDQDALAAGIANVPLGRIGEPEEVASVVLFLASDLSRYVTGTVTEVTGGRNM